MTILPEQGQKLQFEVSAARQVTATASLWSVLPPVGITAGATIPSQPPSPGVRPTIK